MTWNKGKSTRTAKEQQCRSIYGGRCCFSAGISAHFCGLLPPRPLEFNSNWSWWPKPEFCDPVLSFLCADYVGLEMWNRALTRLRLFQNQPEICSDCSQSAAKKTTRRGKFLVPVTNVAIKSSCDPGDQLLVAARTLESAIVNPDGRHGRWSLSVRVAGLTGGGWLLS